MNRRDFLKDSANASLFAIFAPLVDIVPVKDELEGEFEAWEEVSDEAIERFGKIARELDESHFGGFLNDRHIRIDDDWSDVPPGKMELSGYPYGEPYVVPHYPQDNTISVGNTVTIGNINAVTNSYSTDVTWYWVKSVDGVGDSSSWTLSKSSSAT